jgi:DNA-damage-inducible protein D
MNNKDVILFEAKEIRRYYNQDTEIWYFSLVDIVLALSESKNPTDYLKKMRKRDVELNSYLGPNCPQVEMLTNGKKRKTLAGNVEQIFRLIQSIPSPKAEPFKQWLAKVGNERIQEIQDPSLSMDRAREIWKTMGRSEKWIQQRMTG